jgi:predicted transcriptional regulator
MLRMDQVHVIRHKVLLEGKSVRSVAQEMGVSRNTVAKYLKDPEPRRRVAHKQKRAPVMEMVALRIEEILLEWTERTTHKQRITAPGFIASSSKKVMRSASPPSGTTFGRSGVRRQKCSSRSCTAPEMKRRWTSSR